MAFSLICCDLSAQEVELTAKEQAMLQAAEDSLLTENYAFSLEKFSSLLSLHNEEIYFRYKYALCLVELNSQLDQAIDYLELARSSGIPQANYYLGKAYHYRYFFEKAIRYYQKYLDSDIPSKEKTLPAHRQIIMAQNGIKLVEYAYVLDILENNSLKLKDLYYSYDLDRIGGNFIKKHASLQSRIDRKREQDPIMFFSTRHDVILFSSYGKKGRTGKDIYILRRKAGSGEWGDPEKLDAIINTNEDEDYPYLHPSGKELYFCSKGHNSMGGYDIFRSVWNENTQNWGIPVNLDFPVNSPMDDLLYVNDSLNDFAVFASRRDSEKDRVSIYKILIKKDPEKRRIENMQDLIRTSHLDVNLLAGDLERRDDESTVLPEEFLDAEERDVTIIETEPPVKVDDPDMLAYESLKDSVKRNFDEIRKVRATLSADQNRFKHLTRDAWSRNDELTARATLDAVWTYESELKKLQSDLDELEGAYFDLPLKENILPSRQIQSELNAIAGNSENVLNGYQSFSPIEVLQLEIDTEQKKLDAIRHEVEALEERLTENQQSTYFNDFSDEAITKNETIREEQEQLLAELSEKYYDLESQELSLNAKKEKSKALGELMEELSVTSALETELPETEIRRAEQEATEAWLTSLKENKKTRDEENRSKYQIQPWHDSPEYQERLDNALAESSKGKIPVAIIENNEALKRAVQVQDESLINIKNIREQLESATTVEEPELWADMHANLTQLEESQQLIQAYAEESSLMAENESQGSDLLPDSENSDLQNDFVGKDNPDHNEAMSDITSENIEGITSNENETDASENSLVAENMEVPVKVETLNEETQSDQTFAENDRNQTEEVSEIFEETVQEDLKYPDFFESNEERLEFVASTQNAIRDSGLKDFDVIVESERLQSGQERLKEEIIKADVDPDAREDLRNDHVHLIGDLLELNEEALKEAHVENLAVKDEIIKFTEGKPQFEITFNGKITEAERLVEEAESFEIAARSTENPIRKMAFYEKAKTSLKQSNDILSDISESVSGESVLEETFESVPDLNDMRRLVSEMNDPLTESFVAGDFIKENYENYPQDVVLMQSEKREEDFRRSDSLFNQREIIMTQIREKGVLVTDPVLAQEEDKIRFEIADDLNELHEAARPLIAARIIDNHETLEYLQAIGLIEEDKVPELVDFDDARIQIIPKEKTPKQVHADLNRVSVQFENQMKLLHEQEDLINSVRITKRTAVPAEWYDLLNKMQRMAEPEIKVDVNNDLLAFSDYRNTGMAMTPKERKAEQKLLTEISKAKSKEEELSEEIDALLMIENITPEKRQKNIRKLQDELTSESMGRLQNEIRLQRRYLEYNSSASPLAVTASEILVQEIVDSISQQAIRLSEPENLKKIQTVDELLYAKGLLVEANHLREGIHEKRFSTEEDLAGIIRIYRPGYTIRFEEEILAMNNGLHASGENGSQISDAGEVAAETLTDARNQSDETLQDGENETVEAGIDHTVEVINADDAGLIEMDETESEALVENNASSEVEHNTSETNFIKAEYSTESDYTESEEDLFYRIQFAAYRNPNSETSFRGMSPVVDEQVGDRNLYRYLVGKFYNSDSWREALPQVRNQGFGDAFPVAYFNHERISLARAKTLRHLEKDLPAEFRIEITDDGEIIAQRNIDDRGRTEENRTLSPVPFLENENSTFYTIQLGAFGRLLDQSNISGVSADFYHRTGTGYFKYFHGRYLSYADAVNELRIVKQSINDAFIVAFRGTQRINRAEADAELRNESVAEVVPEEIDSDDNQEIEFRVQIGAFSNALSEQEVQYYRETFAPYEVSSVNLGTVIVYYVEGFESYEKAGQALKIMVRPVVGDAFVTAWKGKRKITMKQAMMES